MDGNVHLSLDLLQLIRGFCALMKECYNFSASLSYIADQISLDCFRYDKVQGVCEASDMKVSSIWYRYRPIPNFELCNRVFIHPYRRTMKKFVIN